MTRLFDGLATVYSTCRDCRELMVVLDADEPTHPTCTPKPTKLETLATGYASAVNAGDDQAAELTAEEIARLETAAPELHRHAVHYARIGWPVFPIAMHGKQPAIPSAHPVGDPLRGVCKGECGKLGHGLYDATTDLAQIHRWWTKPYNIGLATGHRFDVIDIDVKSGGVQSFLQLLRDKMIPAVHAVVTTASGGTHLYVSPTGRGNHAAVRSGIDYRGLGGYCVGVPSTRGKAGQSYSWLTVPSPEIKNATTKGNT